jgi:hypothetical protein
MDWISILTIGFSAPKKHQGMKKNMPSKAKLALAAVITANQIASAAVIGFDDLSPGVDWINVPNSYSGLQWDNFAVLIGSYRSLSEGYRIGTTSPQNVAFNKFGDPAEVSWTNTFDLTSAQLTAATPNLVNLTVIGYSGTTQLYSSTITISNTAATRIDFNYLGITRVRFVASPTTQFVLDDLTLSGIPGLTNTPPATNSPGDTVSLGPVQVTTLGHTFGSAPVFPPGGSNPPWPGIAADYLLDENQSSEGGATLPVSTIDWETNTQFQLTIAAPPGMKFQIVPPIGLPVQFGGFLWWESTGGGISPPREVTVTFTGLEGTAPGFAGSDSVLSHTDGFFGWMDVESNPITNVLAFTSITLTGIGGPWHTGAGVQTFIPHAESELKVYYATSATTDPGPCLSIVPASQPLSIQALIVPPALHLTLLANGNAVIIFNGTLQAADSSNGPFEDVLGNPIGSYTVPKTSFGTQKFFRTRIN